MELSYFIVHQGIYCQWASSVCRVCGQKQRKEKVFVVLHNNWEESSSSCKGKDELCKLVMQQSDDTVGLQSGLWALCTVSLALIKFTSRCCYRFLLLFLLLKMFSSFFFFFISVHNDDDDDDSVLFTPSALLLPSDGLCVCVWAPSWNWAKKTTLSWRIWYRMEQQEQRRRRMKSVRVLPLYRITRQRRHRSLLNPCPAASTSLSTNCSTVHCKTTRTECDIVDVNDNGRHFVWTTTTTSASSLSSSNLAFLSRWWWTNTTIVRLQRPCCRALQCPNNNRQLFTTNQSVCAAIWLRSVTIILLLLHHPQPEPEKQQHITIPHRIQSFISSSSNPNPRTDAWCRKMG